MGVVNKFIGTLWKPQILFSHKRCDKNYMGDFVKSILVRSLSSSIRAKNMYFNRMTRNHLQNL